MIRFPGAIRAVGTVDGAGNSRVPTARNGSHTASMGLKTHAVAAHRLQRKRRGSPHPTRLRAIFPRSLPLRFRKPPEKITPPAAPLLALTCLSSLWDDLRNGFAFGGCRYRSPSGIHHSLPSHDRSPSRSWPPSFAKATADRLVVLFIASSFFCSSMFIL